jgi:hypothetical protein
MGGCGEGVGRASGIGAAGLEQISCPREILQITIST